jgi:hypothetical protein
MAVFMVLAGGRFLSLSWASTHQQFVLKESPQAFAERVRNIAKSRLRSCGPFEEFPRLFSTICHRFRNRILSKDDLQIHWEASTVLKMITQTPASNEKRGKCYSRSASRVDELEGELGFRLFQRNHQFVEPTEAGRKFVEQARLALLHVERAVQTGRSANDDAEAILNLGRSPYTDPFLITTLLSIKLPLYPQLKIELSQQF